MAHYAIFYPKLIEQMFSYSQANDKPEKQGHVRCSGGGVFGSLNHSSSSMKNMFRNQESQFN